MVRGPTALITCVLAGALALAPVRLAHSETPRAPNPAPVAGGPEQALTQKIAVWRFDALGIEPELVARLETLFRMELERLAKQPLPSRREIERAVAADQRECTGEEKCLGALGRKLGVDVMVTGTVGAMGDAYVLNIKAIDTASSRQLTRIQSAPLRGTPDELIEGVRVAAYKLLAPTQLHGSLQVATDLVGAQVELDGKPIGKTPLANQGVVGKLALGAHALRVQAPGYSPFEDQVDIHFQKMSHVVVRMLPSTQVIGTGKIDVIERKPFYSRTWFIVGAGVAAILIGGVVGHAIGRVDCVKYVNGGATSC